MKVETCIKERRSVRKYSEKDVSEEVINEVVSLARYAPSWKNTQVVRYHVIKTPQIKADIADHCVLDFEFNAKTIMRCKALVVVTVIKKVSGYENNGDFSTSKGDRWETFDAGIATQTFCLAAHSKGLGSVILGIFDEEKICQYIQIPENERITALIAIGYPLEEGKAAPPRKTVDELVTYY